MENIICPVCKSTEATRSTKGSKDIGRKKVWVTYTCANPKCGHVIKSVLTARKDKDEH